MIKSEDVKGLLTKVIHEHYPSVTIYKNTVQQGAKMPCFFVSQIDLAIDEVAKNRYDLNYLFSIVYRMDNPTRTELECVGFELLNLLTQHNFKSITSEVIDDVLHVKANYRQRARQEEVSLSKINEVEIKGGME